MSGSVTKGHRRRRSSSYRVFCNFWRPTPTFEKRLTRASEGGAAGDEAEAPELGQAAVAERPAHAGEALAVAVAACVHT